MQAQVLVGQDTLRVPLYVHPSKCFYRGDSIPCFVLPTVHKFPPITFRSEEERIKYYRLVANIKRTLPLAKLVKQTVIETYQYLETLPSKRAKDQHIKAAEKGIKQQYSPLVRKLSFTQGKLLVKLISRECNQTSFDIVKAFVGPLRAQFYQWMAGLFGNSLKKQYDPTGFDRETERIVLMIESGQI